MPSDASASSNKENRMGAQYAADSMHGCGLQTPIRDLNTLGNEEHLHTDSHYLCIEINQTLKKAYGKSSL